MEGLRNTPGFLGTDASLLADINLVAHILMFIVLCLGVTAQLKGKYHWHDRFQIPVVVLNFFFIIFVMIPSFMNIAPQLPENLSETFFLVPTIHAVLGLLAQGVATYCLLAGLKILPRKIGVLRYWMWLAFVLWTLATLAGIGIYLVWYTGGSVSSGAAVGEHDGDLVSEHAATVIEAPATQPPAEVVEEHAEEPVVEVPTAVPVEPVEEHAEEAIELVEEHAEEPAEVAAEPTATPEPPTPTPVPTPLGFLFINDDKARGDKVSIEMTGVTPPPDGSVYEAWLTGEGQDPFSVGKLIVTDGAIKYTFTDPQGRNLLGLFNGMFISVEPANDSDLAPSSVVAYNGEVPLPVMEQVRLLVVASPSFPGGDSPAIKAVHQLVTKIEPEVGFQKDYSIAENDLVALKIQAEGIVNIIEGESGPNFGDLDGSGDIYSPGDGFGLLGPGDTAGYLQAVINLATAASQAEGTSAEVKLHAEQTQAAAQNAIGWTEQMRDLELQILQAPDTASAADSVNQVIELLNLLKDTDGTGLTDPSQGGLQAMYTYAQLMGAIEVFPVPGQAAPAAAPTPELIEEHAEESVSEHAGN